MSTQILEFLRDVSAGQGASPGPGQAAGPARIVPPDETLPDGGLSVVDPAQGLPVARVRRDDPADLGAVIGRAAAAQRPWADLTAYERGDVLLGTATRIRASLDDLSAVMTAESGKPLRESRAEWLNAAAVFEWCAEEGKRLYGRIVPARVPGRRIWILRQPIGVVAAITAWNFPAALAARKWAAALAAGCTVIGRPSERTPLSALAMAGLAHQAGVPLDALQVVVTPGQPSAEAFIDDPRVRLLSFTGSEETGSWLIERAARSHTEIRLELGGSAPVIVLDDADPQAAAELSLAAKFRNAGQVCIAPARFLVADAVADDYVDALATRFDALSVGAGTDEATDVGPVIDESALERLSGMVRDSVADGARLLRGGQRMDRPGTFFAPTLLDGVGNSDRISCQEIFGPIVPVTRVRSTHEALAAANDTRFGLAAFVHTRDLDRAFWFAERLEAGIVGINETVPSTAEAPFGGWKDSGNAAEGGIEALLEYTRTKYVAIAVRQPEA
ncbi:NAD-dependent succinate-semialdehyde dehydrogenase [soil metagenome]